MSVPATGMKSTPESRKGTVTQEDQWMVEDHVFRIYHAFSSIPPNARTVMLELKRDNHIQYLTNGLRQLPSSFAVLDANRPWLCYWILHSIALLGESIDTDQEHNVIDFLSRCQDKDGGYGGGPGQMPHLATTYAAVNSLITLGGHRSLSSINRGKIYSFLLRMKHTSGGFSMHDGGEVDVRACYTAISVASALNILDHELTQNVGDYILSCQTYEGGISGEPGSEAHGGYTFCGLAAMILINEVNRLDLASLTGGAVVLIQKLHKIAGQGQCSEGSTLSSTASDLSEDEQCFEGTSSHVSEACHNTEEGQQNASDQMNSCALGSNFIQRYTETEPLFQSIALQQYILCCSQMEGGFRDKPGKNRDHYHTCYCLSGLSAAQYSLSEDADTPPLPRAVLGPYSNLLEPTNPLYNIVSEKYNEAREFFASFS